MDVDIDDCELDYDTFNEPLMNSANNVINCADEMMDQDSANKEAETIDVANKPPGAEEEVRNSCIATTQEINLNAIEKENKENPCSGIAGIESVEPVIRIEKKARVQSEVAQKNPMSQFNTLVREMNARLKEIHISPATIFLSLPRRSPPSSASTEPTCIIHIRCLRRPFTVRDLLNLLTNFGTIAEDGFWIDSIRSQCIVKYETEQEAKLARDTLHDVKWPAGSDQFLSIEYTNAESLNRRFGLTSNESDLRPLETPIFFEFRHKQWQNCGYEKETQSQLFKLAKNLSMNCCETVQLQS